MSPDGLDFLEVLFLNPGDFHFGGGPTRVRTLLGSCVAITVWHPVRFIGGMCHFVLPERMGRDRGECLDGRYADDAMEMFLARMRAHATAPAEYVVKVFGGGHMFAAGKSRAGAEELPARNVARARELLARHGFRIEAEDVGGTTHRSLALDLWSGDVWLKQS